MDRGCHIFSILIENALNNIVIYTYYLKFFSHVNTVVYECTLFSFFLYGKKRDFCCNLSAFVSDFDASLDRSKGKEQNEKKVLTFALLM